VRRRGDLLAFGDDMFVMSNNQHEVEMIVDELAKLTSNWYLRINKKKADILKARSSMRSGESDVPRWSNILFSISDNINSNYTLSMISHCILIILVEIYNLQMEEEDLLFEISKKLKTMRSTWDQEKKLRKLHD
jgi:hypothetical protein